jgi:hypothetical protein
VPVEGRSWLAHCLSVAGPEKYDGVIRAHSREEAVSKAREKFGPYKPVHELSFRCERCGTRGDARETLR